MIHRQTLSPAVSIVTCMPWYYSDTSVLLTLLPSGLNSPEWVSENIKKLFTGCRRLLSGSIKPREVHRRERIPFGTSVRCPDVLGSLQLLSATTLLIPVYLSTVFFFSPPPPTLTPINFQAIDIRKPSPPSPLSISSCFAGWKWTAAARQQARGEAENDHHLTSRYPCLPVSALFLLVCLFSGRSCS